MDAISLQLKLKIMTEMYLASNEALKGVQSENKQLKLHIKGMESQLKETTKKVERSSGQRRQLIVKVQRYEYFIRTLANEILIMDQELAIDRHCAASLFRKLNEKKEELKKAEIEIAKLKQSLEQQTISGLLDTAFSENQESILWHETLEIIANVEQDTNEW